MEAKSRGFAVYKPKGTGNIKELPRNCSSSEKKAGYQMQFGTLWLENCNPRVHLNEKPSGKLESA